MRVLKRWIGISISFRGIHSMWNWIDVLITNKISPLKTKFNISKLEPLPLIFIPVNGNSMYLIPYRHCSRKTPSFLLLCTLTYLRLSFLIWRNKILKIKYNIKWTYSTGMWQVLLNVSPQYKNHFHHHQHQVLPNISIQHNIICTDSILSRLF